MTAQTLVNLATVLAWAVVAYRLPSLLRQPRDPVRRTYWLALFLLAAALTVLLPGLQAAIATSTGIPYLAHLFGNAFVLGAAWATQVSLYHATYPPLEAPRRSRRIGLVVVAALGLMAVCFALATGAGEAVAFTGRYQHASFLLGYRLVYLVGIALAIGNFARLSWRYARRSSRPSLQIGLRLVAIAGVIGLAYVANEGLRAATERLGRANPVPNPDAVSQLLIALSMSLGLIGTTLPAWGPRLGIPVLVTWLRHYRALRRLYPLWTDLYHAQPRIALFPPRSPIADLLTVRDLRFHLYRRVIEIRDGQLLLCRHLDARPAAAARQRCVAAGLSEAETHAVIEATEIAAALRAGPGDDDPTPPRAGQVLSGARDVVGEVAALERVARCYRRSPIVRVVVDQLDRETAPAESTERIMG
jgi:hypothetical protein